MMSKEGYLGIDLGGTKIGAGLVSPAGSITERIRQAVDRSSDRSALEQIKRILRSFHGRELQGIGLGVPGIADQKRRTVWCQNIRGWDHIPLFDELEKHSTVPVVIESDRNTAILGEMLFGTAKGKSDAIFLILGTGIGAGIVSGGHLLRGGNEIGGAIGWMPVLFRGELRHFEEICAGPGIERIAQEGGLPGHLPDLAAQARAGDRKAIELFREVGHVLGQALGTLVSTFNPEIIVIGGGVSHVWELLSECARQSLERWSQPIAVKQVTMAVSRLGEDAGILGAAAAVRGRRVVS